MEREEKWEGGIVIASSYTPIPSSSTATASPDPEITVFSQKSTVSCHFHVNHTQLTQQSSAQSRKLWKLPRKRKNSAEKNWNSCWVIVDVEQVISICWSVEPWQCKLKCFCGRRTWLIFDYFFFVFSLNRTSAVAGRGGNWIIRRPCTYSRARTRPRIIAGWWLASWLDGWCWWRAVVDISAIYLNP